MFERAMNPFFKVIPNDETGIKVAATFSGIALKAFYFIILTGLGMGLYFMNILPKTYFMPGLLIAVGTAFVTGFASLYIPSLIPITGSLYSLAQGFILAIMCVAFSSLYKGIIPIALMVTLLVVLVMLFLYATGLVKVGQTFKTIVFTLFMMSIVGSGLVFISRFFTDSIASVVYGNGLIGIGVSVVSVIIAALYLVVDFDNIVKGVKYKVDKKHEWTFSFGLITTIVLLFMRILVLVSKLMSKKNN